MSHYWNSPFITWANELPAGWDMYVCRLRTSRLKARVAAICEALALLNTCQPRALLSGALADQKGVYWLAIHADYRQRVNDLAPFFGYTSEIGRIVPVSAVDAEFKWRGADYALMPIYAEPTGFMQERAPDKRRFMLRDAQGDIVPVQGYRGDGKELSRRGLAPEDARLLVNLVSPATETCLFLEPFAGVGGLVVEAVERGWQIISGDIDPILRHGLQHFSQRHTVMDASQLPFANATFTALASEPPFHASAHAEISRFMGEACRVLVPAGKVALMVVDWQMPILEQHAQQLNMPLLLKEEINRKGTDVWIGVWQKPKN